MAQKKEAAKSGKKSMKDLAPKTDAKGGRAQAQGASAQGMASLSGAQQQGSNVMGNKPRGAL